MQHIVALLGGLVFGLGLLLSGMTDPGKVQGFLDITTRWDPSLALVMGGAVLVASLAFAWARRSPQSWLGAQRMWPSAGAIDTRLLAGGALFGLGWGLAGFCPGPALVALSAGMADAWIFVPAMLAGMALHDRFLA
ncbi:MAG: DUF6691 family protein [Rubrivivax sp.]|jgi:uncharacterized membrane protein YedE/YeeE